MYAPYYTGVFRLVLHVVVVFSIHVNFQLAAVNLFPPCVHVHVHGVFSYP